MLQNNEKSTVLQLRVTPKVKQTAKKLLEFNGLTLSRGIQNFLSNISLHEDALMLAFDQPKISKKKLAQWENEVAHDLKHAKRFLSTKEAIKHLRTL